MGGSPFFDVTLMQQKDTSNTIFDLAVDLVNHTSQHIFLTGKAGTGKTTFLRHIRETTGKNTVVVAPTGVAAINAGGVTMHSFFQLPRGSFIPGTMNRDNFIGYAEVTDKHSLFKNIHFTTNKRQLLQELELLIIDEVSMMRCDMLDAIDTVLRHFRRLPHVPFGGVQVVYIGDLFQLPPVVAQGEWQILQDYYESPFFFSARAVAEAPPLYIELKKIYRQSEAQFISVLNNVRNNHMTRDDFELLNSRFNPAFVPPANEDYITVTTHNRKADEINAAALAKLPGTLHSFKAEIKDDFSDKALPTEMDLQLKVGAQVMFIKNDSNAERRYFNGKLARVKKILNGQITVSFMDGSEDLLLEKETWKNIRYIYNKENDDIDEEELGSFTQYPIRLAWAITVHKSQGLTFEHAIIDAGASFAPGQVYVALSRCTSLDGMVLRSRINANAISTDRRILSFAEREMEDDELLLILEKEKYRHWGNALMKLFNWSKLVTNISEWARTIPDKKLPKVDAALTIAHAVLDKAQEHAGVAHKFQRQLEALLPQTEQTGDTALLHQRMSKAVSYFSNALVQDVLLPVQQHLASLQYATKIKKYKVDLKETEGFIWHMLQKLVHASYGTLTFCENKEGFDQYAPKHEEEVKEISKGKKEKGATQKETLELYRSGKTVAEIAALRNLAPGTIETHLARFVRTGDIDITELVEADKIEGILKVIEQVGTESMGAIKGRCPDDVSYSEIRAVMHYHALLNEQVPE